MAQQLMTLAIVAPGSLGMNKQGQNLVLPPGFAVKASNAIIDAQGRLAARKGYSVVTTTGITSSPAVEQVHEYRDGAGNVEMIVSWDGGIGNDLTDPEGNDISGTVTDTDGNWQFQDFNGNVYGAGNGEIIKYTGTGNFTALTPGFTPDGPLLAAYGRLWATSNDKQTVNYTPTLSDDFTDVGSGAGSIDMQNVWTNGTDIVTAIAAWNGLLVIFGQRHIVMWTDGANNQLGLQPADMYVLDVITGTGCIARDSVKHVDAEDMLFLSRNGVQSIKRAIEFSRNPSSNMTKYVRAALSDDVQNETLANVRAEYHAEEGFYLLSLPGRTKVYVIDMRNKRVDEQGDLVAPVTEWALTLYSMCSTASGVLYFGLAGEVGQYTGLTDDGATFRFSYLSPWMDLGEDVAFRLKILKAISAVFLVHGDPEITFLYSYDFSTVQNRHVSSFEYVTLAEWGTSEWGIAEFGGATRLAITTAHTSGHGQYIQIGVEVDVEGPFAVQQLQPIAKIGRPAGGLSGKFG